MIFLFQERSIFHNKHISLSQFFVVLILEMNYTDFSYLTEWWNETFVFIYPKLNGLNIDDYLLLN